MSYTHVKLIDPWGTFYCGFFPCDSYKMEILFCSYPNCYVVIATKFCTWHDSTAVMPCAKFYSNLVQRNVIIAKPSFYWIWNMTKSFSEISPMKFYAWVSAVYGKTWTAQTAGKIWYHIRWIKVMFLFLTDILIQISLATNHFMIFSMILRYNKMKIMSNL